MELERWQQIDRLCRSALQQEPSQRAAFVEEACAGDEVLRREVESLLAQGEGAENFLEAPALQVAAKALAQDQARSPTRGGEAASMTARAISHYRVVEKLGGGGMGEVYKAQDTRLARQVALKFLRQGSVRDPQALERFKREARAASALNHPNICTIHDIDEFEGQPFIAMEFLEGQTLRERLAGARLAPAKPSQGSALRIEEVLDFAIQIADGLGAAHQKGITHRDIKPANIFITSRGQAKILDFGLAKLAEPAHHGLGQEFSGRTNPRPFGGEGAPSIGAGEEAAQQNRPTGSIKPEALTIPGMVMGTVAYMSPEQARGEKLDARTDLFSFGTVLYEAATGKPAFAGDSQAAIIATVLEKAPTPPRDLRKDVPASLQAVVHRCLEKDRDRRWQCAADLVSELRRIANAPERRAPVASANGRSRERMVWIACCAVLLVASVVIGLRRTSAPIAQPVVRSAVLAPDGARFAFVGDVGGPLVLSPDGHLLAFVAANPAGQNQLYVRPLGSSAARPISASESAVFPFWSPDSKSLGFFAEHKLRRVEIAGGAPVSLCEVGDLPRGGAWSSSGAIVFASSTRGGLSRVSDQGGKPTLLTKLDEPQHTTHRWPYFLPDGNHFLYLAANHHKQSEGAAIYYAALDGSVNKPLLHTKGNAVFANEHVLFVNGTELLARPFDVKKGEFAGEAVSLAADVLYDPGVWRGMFTASEAALLAYQPGGIASDWSVLKWVDRGGKVMQQVGEKRSQTTVRVSSSGHWTMIIESSAPTGADLWLLSTPNGEHRRLTFSGDVGFPVCSPDERWVAYTRESQGIYRRPISGTGNEEVLLHTSDPVIASTWSPDGKYLVFQRDAGAARTGRDLWLLPIEAERTPRPLLQTNADEYDAEVSPDGRWIAYTSTEDGQREVYLSPFPSMSAKRQISLAGGSSPRWRGDGREIFYLSSDDTIHAAQMELAGGDHLDVVGVTPLFRADLRSVVQGSTFDVAPDGQRFLLNSPGEEQGKPVMLVQNWPAEIAPKQF
jgi:serine/threonine protein kinase/Tol biopolymer transport system component